MKFGLYANFIHKNRLYPVFFIHLCFDGTFTPQNNRAGGARPVSVIVVSRLAACVRGDSKRVMSSGTLDDFTT